MLKFMGKICRQEIGSCIIFPDLEYVIIEIKAKLSSCISVLHDTFKWTKSDRKFVSIK